jgi:hypothetical protein
LLRWADLVIPPKMVKRSKSCTRTTALARLESAEKRVVARVTDELKRVTTLTSNPRGFLLLWLRFEEEESSSRGEGEEKSDEYRAQGLDEALVRYNSDLDNDKGDWNACERTLNATSRQAERTSLLISIIAAMVVAS